MISSSTGSVQSLVGAFQRPRPLRLRRITYLTLEGSMDTFIKTALLSRSCQTTLQKPPYHWEIRLRSIRLPRNSSSRACLQEPAPCQAKEVMNVARMEPILAIEHKYLTRDSKIITKRGEHLESLAQASLPKWGSILDTRFHLNQDDGQPRKQNKRYVCWTSVVYAFNWLSQNKVDSSIIVVSNEEDGRW